MQDSTPQIFDPGHLPGLVHADMPDLFVEFLTGFIKQSASVTDTLRQQLQQGAHDHLIHTAHRLKNTSDLVGAFRASELFKRIERLAREGDFALLPGILPDLEDTIERTLEAIRPHLAELESRLHQGTMPSPRPDR